MSTSKHPVSLTQASHANALLTVKSTVQVTVSPNPVTVRTSAALQFTSAVTGTTNTNVTWLVNGILGGSAEVGTISAAGLYVAPANVPTQNPVAVSARSVGDTTASGSASVTLIAAAANQFTINFLNEMQAAPFALLTVNGSGWDPSQPVLLRFTIGGGNQVDIPALYTAPAQIVVGVPPLIDLSNGTTSGGQTSVQVVQTSGAAITSSNVFGGLQVQDLPATNLPPGTITLGLIDGLVLVSKDLEIQLAYDEMASGGQATTGQLRSTLEAIIAQAANLKTQYQALVTDPSNTFPLGNGSQLIVDQKSLLLTERILFAWLAQMDKLNQSGQITSQRLKAASVRQTSASTTGSQPACSFSQKCPEQIYITQARPPVLRPASTNFGDGMDAFLQVATAIAGFASKSVGDASSLVSLASAIRITFPGVTAYLYDTISLAVPGGDQAIKSRLADADVLALQAQQPSIAKAAVDVLGVALGAADPLAGLIFGILTAMASHDAQLPALGLQPAAFFVNGTVTSNLNGPVSGALVTCSNFSFWANGFAVTLGDDSFSSAVPQNSTTLNVPTNLTCVVTKTGFLSSQLMIDLKNLLATYPVILNQAAVFATPSSLSFSASPGGTNPPSKTLNIETALSGGTNWSAKTDALWLHISASNGATPATIQVSVDITGLLAGTYTGNVILTPTAAPSSPLSVPVTLVLGTETWVGSFTGTELWIICGNGSWNINYQGSFTLSGSLVAALQTVNGFVPGTGTLSGTEAAAVQPAPCIPGEPANQLLTSMMTNLPIIVGATGPFAGFPQSEIEVQNSVLPTSNSTAQGVVPDCSNGNLGSTYCVNFSGIALFPSSVTQTTISGVFNFCFTGPGACGAPGTLGNTLTGTFVLTKEGNK
jgi:hypothetical protein